MEKKLSFNLVPWSSQNTKADQFKTGLVTTAFQGSLGYTMRPYLIKQNSVGRGICHPACWPDFVSQGPHSKKGEPIPEVAFWPHMWTQTHSLKM